MSAYLLRASTGGSLHTVPGDDWYTVQNETKVLVPYAQYTTNVNRNFDNFTLDETRRWRVICYQSGDGAGIEIPYLRLRGVPYGMGEGHQYYFPFGSANATIITDVLPAGTYNVFVTGGAGWQPLTMAAILQSVPIGAL